MRMARYSRRGNEMAPSREARVEIGDTRITLQIGAGPDDPGVDPIVIDVEAPVVGGNRWADGAASYAQTQGRMLWGTVFTGALGLGLTQAARDADSVGQSLTVRVVPAAGVGGAHFWQPWELLFDSSQGGFVALAANRSVIRGVPSDVPPRALPLDRPLRVAAVEVAVPKYEFAGEELGSLRLLDGTSGGPCVVTTTAIVDQQDVLAFMRSADADVIHVIGSGLGPDGLAARDPRSAMPLPVDGVEGARDLGRAPTPHRLSVEAFAAAVVENPAVSVVVLNGCHMGDLGYEINRRGGAAVIGHRKVVSDRHAVSFAKAFYNTLIDGRPLDLAIADTRRAMELEYPGEVSWGESFLFCGWPPPRFEGPGNEEVPTIGAPPPPGGAVDPSIGEDLVRYMHETNLARLTTLPHDAWAPIAEQIKIARTGLGEP